MKSTISSKGQVTIPVEIRAALGLRPGTPVVFESRPGGAFLRKGIGTSGRHPVDRVFGQLELSASVDALLEQMRGAERPRSPRRRARRRRAAVRP